MVFGQFAVKSWGRAELVVKLIDELSAERHEQKSFISDCVLAATSNEHFRRALRFMKHECPLCYQEVAMCNVCIKPIWNFSYRHEERKNLI